MTGELLSAKAVVKIGQRIEFFVGKDEEGCMSRIENMTDDTLTVAMPMTAQGVPVIPYTNEEVQAIIIENQCKYRFSPKFLQTHMEDERIPAWIITRPDVVERFQDREYVRVPIGIPMSVRIVDETGTIGEAVQTKTLDASGGGISFLSSEKIKVGSRAAIELYDIPEIGMFENFGIVARCMPIDRGDGRPLHAIGVAFVHLPRPILNRLVRYLFSVQREQIARGVRV